jgi:hypothetical protein
MRDEPDRDADRDPVNLVIIGNAGGDPGSFTTAE